MIELISILCSLAICVFTPIEVERIRHGWTGKRFADDRGKFLAAYRKQLTLLIWLGVGFAAITLALTFVEPRSAERVVKYVAATIWVAVAGICVVSRRRLPVF